MEVTNQPNMQNQHVNHGRGANDSSDLFKMLLQSLNTSSSAFNQSNLSLSGSDVEQFNLNQLINDSVVSKENELVLLKDKVEQLLTDGNLLLAIDVMPTSQINHSSSIEVEVSVVLWSFIATGEMSYGFQELIDQMEIDSSHRDTTLIGREGSFTSSLHIKKSATRPINGILSEQFNLMREAQRVAKVEKLVATKTHQLEQAKHFNPNQTIKPQRLQFSDLSSELKVWVRDYFTSPLEQHQLIKDMLSRNSQLNIENIAVNGKSYKEYYGNR